MRKLARFVTLSALMTSIATPATARPESMQFSPLSLRRTIVAKAKTGKHGAANTKRPPCKRRGDLLIPLKYLHGGAVWIPSEVRCGGTVPVVVLLHGNNTSRETVKSLGPGPESRRFDLLARKYLSGRHIEPVVLAEPIHFAACASDAARKGMEYLFSGQFDFVAYRRLLEETLRKQGIRVKSWSFVGHSGAACCLQMGMFGLAKAWPTVRVWASADGCYSGDSQATALLKQFGGQRTKIINACRGAAAYPGYKAYEKTLLGEAADVPCDKKYYVSCRRHPDKPWYSFVTQFAGAEKHSQVLVEIFKTVLFNDFPSARRIAAAQQAEARKQRLAALRKQRQRVRPAPGTVQAPAQPKAVRARRVATPPKSGRAFAEREGQ